MDWLSMLLSGLGPGAAMAGGLSDGLMTDPATSLPASTTPVPPAPPPMPPMETLGGGPSQTLGQIGPQTLGAGGGTGNFGAMEAPGLGASLEPGAPAGAPMDLRSMNQKRMGGSQMMPGGGGMPGDKLVAALRGLQAPKPPDVVKPSTPAAPQARPIQGGDQIIQLLQQLSNPRAGMRPQVPTTLGGALGTGRY